MTRPRLLDLYCGAGGAAVGYDRAGYDVTGVDIDIRKQRRYPFTFVHSDAIQFLREHGSEYDVIHASPPCQLHSWASHTKRRNQVHIDFIEPTRRELVILGKPYVIENVGGARFELIQPIMLCGTSFGLRIQRHRYFEIPSLAAVATPKCNHNKFTDYNADHGKCAPENLYKDAMGCGWMTVRESRQAIPPAYTEWIGRVLINDI